MIQQNVLVPSKNKSVMMRSLIRYRKLEPVEKLPDSSHAHETHHPAALLESQSRHQLSASFEHD
jgi:hypothetical protein